MSESPRREAERDHSPPADEVRKERYSSPRRESRGRSRSRDRRRSADRRNDAATIYIAKLARGTREADLKEGFTRYGAVKNIVMKSSYAFLTFESQESVKEAIEKMNGAKFVNGEELLVEQSGTEFKMSS